MTKTEKHTPDIWLQENEIEGRADCGCRLVDRDDGPAFSYCAAHRAAPDLLAAAKEALRQLDAPDCPSIPDGAMVRGALYSAIARAEGKEVR